jgi:hypothetical protein
MGNFSKSLNKQLGISGGRQVVYNYDHMILVPNNHREYYVRNGEKSNIVRLNARAQYHEDETGEMEGRQNVALVAAPARKQYGVDYPIEASDATALGLDPEYTLFSKGNVRYYPAMLPFHIQEGDVVLINHNTVERVNELDNFRNFDILKERFTNGERNKWKVFSVRDRHIYGVFRDGRWNNFGEWIFLKPGTVSDAIKIGLAHEKHYGGLDLAYMMSQPYLQDAQPWKEGLRSITDITQNNQNRLIGIAQVMKDFDGIGPVEKGYYKKGDWVFIKPKSYYLFENDAISLAEGIATVPPDKSDSLTSASMLHVFSVFDILAKWNPEQ